MKNHHILLISFPAQGHVNPTLQLAKLLTRAGSRVTFATTVHGLRRMNTAALLAIVDGLSFASFSDGNDDGTRPFVSLGHMMAELKHVGYTSLRTLLDSFSSEGRQVNFVIYNLLFPWVAEVAREMHVPSALLCSQSATTFAVYHRYFNCYNGLCNEGNSNIDRSKSVELPGFPFLTWNDVPSFLLPNDPHACMVPTFQEHIQALEKDPKPCILVNTFDFLEEGSIRAIDNYNNIKIIPIGPLIPSAYVDETYPLDKSFGCDLFDKSTSYLPWLDSKPQRSVIYVSFGSLAVLKKIQKEEILKGLVESGRPFLVVDRSSENEEVKDIIKSLHGSRNELLNEEGLVVSWCSQLEVLFHNSTGCFLTHCGWNSTVESMVAGVPLVACPQFSDQITNAKMVEDVWGTGVRAGVRARARANEEGVVGGEEIRRCLDIVMGGGERGEEIRKNALKWKVLAVEAAKEGGSSHNNLKEFLGNLG